MERDERLLNAMNNLRLASKGSLWHIKEAVWNEVIPYYEVKRKAHPGLVFYNKQYGSLKDTVSVMIGSSRDNECIPGFMVKDVMPNSPSRKKYTYFHMIKPCAIPEEATPSEALAIAKFDGFHGEIQRNLDKPNLNMEEMEELDRYLANKGIKP